MTLSTHTIAARLADVRERTPLVQCITNAVVMQFTANALLAIGASPAMVDIPDEAGPFSKVAFGLLINLGTPRAEQRAAMHEAARAATAAGTPWVLDPVAIGVLPVRTQLAAEMLVLHPTVIRGNPSEIIALAGLGQGGSGTDATDSPDAALPAARQLAREHGSVVAVSGATDIITDGNNDYRIGNGSPLLTRVTGGGCALGAVIAAFLGACHGERLDTVTAAVAAYTIAADVAAAHAHGPGSFRMHFIDALADIDTDTITTRLVLS